MSEEKQILSEIQKKFVLPFSAPESGTAKFSIDKEVATIFALAEMDREKGGRIISRHSSENITFIAKIGYPLCFYPLADKIFLFDGLNMQECKLPYADIGDVKSFLYGLKSSIKKRESFISFIEEHTNYFAKSDVKKTVQLKALITDSGMLKELGACRHEASDSEGQFAEIGLLSSPISESKLMAVTHEIAQLRSALEKECKELNLSIELLGKASSAFHNELHEEIEAVKQESALEIREEEAIVAPILRSIHEQYDRKIISLTKKIEKQEVPLQSEKLQFKKNKKELTKEISNFEASAKLVADNDKEGKLRWKSKIQNAKEELSATEKHLKSNEKALEYLEKKKVSETQGYKSELETEIKGARSRIVELEATRDAKVMVIKQDMGDLEKQTKLLSDKIIKVVKLLEADVAQFDRLHMKSFSKSLDKALIYMPFYVISYNKEGKNRCLVVPPSLMNEMGMSAKLKGAFGRSRIKFFLAPKFKEIAILAKNIEELNKVSSVFATELKRLGAMNNILARGWICDEIEKGLLTLKEQGWLNNKEYGAVMASAKTALKPNA